MYYKANDSGTMVLGHENDFEYLFLSLEEGIFIDDILDEH